jgi:hypothetical protein
MMLQREYRAACGGRIIVPRKTADHLRAHPEVVEHLGDAIARVQLPDGGAFLRVAVEMGRLVGPSGLVETAPIAVNELALFAHRIGRDFASRVVVGEQGPEVSTIAVLAFADKADFSTYVLITAFVGDLAPREPWDPNFESETERTEALEFWSSHALVWDSDVMSAPFESTWAEILG